METPVSRVLLVTGPPCAGKSTLVSRMWTPGVLIVDRDEIARRIGSPNKWMHPERYKAKAESIMVQTMAEIANSDTIRAFVIRSAPIPEQRDALAAYLRADVRVVDPGRAECVRRAMRDRRPRGTVRWINRWYALAQQVR